MQKRVKWERLERSVKNFADYVRSKDLHSKENFYLNNFLFSCCTERYIEKSRRRSRKADGERECERREVRVGGI